MCRYLLQQQVALLSKCVSSLSMKTGHLLSTIHTIRDAPSTILPSLSEVYK